MVAEAPTTSIVDRPPRRVTYTTWLMLVIRTVARYIDTDAEYLWRPFATTIENFGQALGQMAARGLGGKGVTGLQLHPRLIVGPVRPIPRNANVAGGDSFHRPVVVEQDFSRREARENLDSE